MGAELPPHLFSIGQRGHRNKRKKVSKNSDLGYLDSLTQVPSGDNRY